MESTTRKGKTFQDLVKEAKAGIAEITVDTLRQWQAEGKDIVLLDVRERENYQDGHISKAVSLPRGILELEIDEVVPHQEQPIVTYCGGGSRSALAAQTLGQMGYSQVYSLAGGWREWSKG